MLKNKRVTLLLLVLLTSLVSLIPPLRAQLNLPTIDEVDYVIEEIKYCIEIHQWYIENDYKRKYTGDVEWHERWIDSYNKTLEILYAYRYLVKMLRYEESFRTWS